MPIVTLTFNHEINTSTQVGDKAYYVNTSPVGTANTWASTTTPHDSADREDIREIGVIETIDSDQSLSIVTIDMPNSLSSLYGPPQDGDFIMFSKDNKVNLASLVGYYSTVKLRNNSKDMAELFNVNSDFTESSK